MTFPWLTKAQAETFLERLEGPEGCDFQQRDPKNIETMTWKCRAGRDQSKASRILKQMGFAKWQISELLAFCTEQGGHCDCEILFNAADALRESATAGV